MSDSESEPDPIYNTQPPDETDEDIYKWISEHCGKLDRNHFEQYLTKTFSDNEKELSDVRLSLYDYAKSNCQNVPNGH